MCFLSRRITEPLLGLVFFLFATGVVHADIWLSPGELAAIPMQGSSWDQLKSQALSSAGTPNISDQNQNNNVYVLAKALVYARCNIDQNDPECSDINLNNLRNEVINQVMSAMGTEDGGRTLALGRELLAYVIAADLVQLPATQDNEFRNWLSDVRYETLDGKTLISTHEVRPNNWGTHAGASRIAAAMYLNDTADLERAAQVFRGWLGDRTVYAGFDYGDLTWQCDQSKPVGINPKGCTRDGHSIDGVLPDDERRAGGSFTWPPPKENYVYEGLQGAIVQAVLLNRAGYDAFNWEDKAILRAYQWLYNEADFPAQGDDTWQMPLVDYYYGTNYWDGSRTNTGKNMGWTGWTHAVRGGGMGEPVMPPMPPNNITIEVN